MRAKEINEIPCVCETISILKYYNTIFFYFSHNSFTIYTLLLLQISIVKAITSRAPSNSIQYTSIYIREIAVNLSVIIPRSDSHCQERERLYIKTLAVYIQSMRERGEVRDSHRLTDINRGAA